MLLSECKKDQFDCLLGGERSVSVGSTAYCQDLG